MYRVIGYIKTLLCFCSGVGDLGVDFLRFIFYCDGFFRMILDTWRNLLFSLVFFFQGFFHVFSEVVWVPVAAAERENNNK